MPRRCYQTCGVGHRAGPDERTANVATGNGRVGKLLDRLPLERVANSIAILIAQPNLVLFGGVNSP
jgi:hypothetical protein